MSSRECHRQFLRAKFESEVLLDSLREDDKELLERIGAWLRALADGLLTPDTPAQLHFVEVTKGRAIAETAAENAWVRYRLEVRYQDLLELEERAGSAISYPELRKRFSRLARVGHDGARKWLEREGCWSDSKSNVGGTNVVWDRGAVHYLTHLYATGGTVPQQGRGYGVMNPYTAQQRSNARRSPRGTR
jgi:hypothetical protein